MAIIQTGQEEPYNFQVYVGNHAIYSRIEDPGAQTTFTVAVSEFLSDPDGPVASCEGCSLLMMKGTDDCHLHADGYYLCVDCPDDDFGYYTKFPETCR